MHDLAQASSPSYLSAIQTTGFLFWKTIELDRQEFNYCFDKISEVMSCYDLSYENTWIFIDASSVVVVTVVKQSLDERPDYLEIIARRKKPKIKDPCYDMVVVPRESQHNREKRYAGQPQADGRRGPCGKI